jgi:hypothetical protein
MYKLSKKLGKVINFILEIKRPKRIQPLESKTFCCKSTYAGCANKETFFARRLILRAAVFG